MDDVTKPNAKLLYIEDNPANAALMARIMVKRPSITLFVASTGADGQQIAVDILPQLLIVDNRLPDATGEQIIQRIQTALKEKMPPAIVLSADSNPQVVSRLLALGVAHYITKPYDVKGLLGVIDSYCT